MIGNAWSARIRACNAYTARIPDVTILFVLPQAKRLSVRPSNAARFAAAIRALSDHDSHKRHDRSTRHDRSITAADSCDADAQRHREWKRGEGEGEGEGEKGLK